MRQRELLVLCLLLVGCLAGCGKSPVYSSDARIKSYVQSQIAGKRPNAKLTNFQVGQMTTVGDVDKREFSATIQSSDPSDPIAIKGHFSFDKKAGTHEYTYRN